MLDCFGTRLLHGKVLVAFVKHITSRQEEAFAFMNHWLPMEAGHALNDEGMYRGCSKVPHIPSFSKGDIRNLTLLSHHSSFV